MSVMPKPTKIQPHYPYNINARLAPRHYSLLMHIADALDISVSEALRTLLDEVLRDPNHVSEENRRFFEIVQSTKADPEWIAKHGDPEDQALPT